MYYAAAVAWCGVPLAKHSCRPDTWPPVWSSPSRQSLGAALLAGGDAPQAESVFRRDLEQYPHNGWSMFGLIQSLESQGKNEEAVMVRQHFDNAWQFADIELTAAVL